MSAPVAAVRSDSPDQTRECGMALGRALRPGDVLVLSGELGAGKTCLVSGIVAGAGGDGTAVRSPTFVLHQPHRAAGLTVHHIDLYRLGRGASLEVLDLQTALEDGAAVIEWGEYADLTGFGPARIAIDAAGAAHDRRLLTLHRPAPAHLVRAWDALVERRSTW